MDIPLCYPKIPTLKKFSHSSQTMWGDAWAWEKIDGTNIHWVVRGGVPVEFGTRRTRFPFTAEGIEAFDLRHPGLEGCHRIVRGRPFPDVDCTLFTEYTGPGTFSGHHDPNAHPTDFQLFLIDVEKEGRILPPSEFIQFTQKSWTSWPDHPKLLFKGRISSGQFGSFLDEMARGGCGEIEGVVCKGPWGSFKLKTDEWEARYREKKESER